MGDGATHLEQPAAEVSAEEAAPAYDERVRVGHVSSLAGCRETGLGATRRW